MIISISNRTRTRASQNAPTDATKTLSSGIHEARRGELELRDEQDVTGNATTVSEEKTTRTFIITQFTEITVNGQRATIVDLKPGMTASVTIGMDPTRVSRVVATGVPVGGNQKKN